jgi:hypothetical protein
MLVPLIYASGYAGAFLLFDCLSKRLKSWWVYWLVFIAVYGMSYMVERHVSGGEYIAYSGEDIRYGSALDYTVFDTTRGVRAEMSYSSKVQYHKREAARHFCEAEDMCVFLPDDKRDVAYQLFESCVEATAATWIGGWPGLIADLVTQLARYGVFCCKQADKIREHLKESEYHYYMACYYYNKD